MTAARPREASPRYAGAGGRVLAAVKTWMLVGTVSMLIWIWAEGESLKTETVSAKIVLSQPEGAEPAAVAIPLQDRDRPEGAEPPPLWNTAPGTGIGAPSAAIQLRLEGSTLAVENLTRWLQEQPIKLAPGQPGVPDDLGERVVDLRAAVQAHPRFRSSGVTVLEARPARATVLVVAIEDRTISVDPDLTGLEVDGDVQVSPATVQVRLPSRYARAVGDALVARAVIGPTDREVFRADNRVSVRATLQLPRNPATDSLSASERTLIRWSPDTVTVTLKLRRAVEAVTVPFVDVWYTLPASSGPGWEVEILDPRLRDVSLTGPSEIVKQVQSGRLSLRAIVDLSTEDLVPGFVSKQVRFEGLPSMTSVEVTCRESAVRVRVQKR